MSHEHAQGQVHEEHDQGRDPDHDHDDPSSQDPSAHEHHGHDHEAHDHGHDHGQEAHDHGHPGGVRGLVLSVLRPHSHDAADAVDASLEASQEGMRALKISLAGLAVTAALQLVIVVLSGSVGLLADTIHNAADALTAVPLAAAFWLGRRPANDRYTYGYGRSEDLAGICIVITIAVSSAIAAFEAVRRLANPRPVHYLAWVMAAGLVGFVGNEMVARYRIRVGRRIGSAALEADGYHARTDGFTSLAVVVGAIGVAAGWRYADPLVGLLITVAILAVLKNAARDIYRRLMDAVDPKLVAAVRTALLDVEGIEAVDGVRIRWVGHELHAEADVVSAASLSLREAHDIAEEARHRLLHDIPRLMDITIHSSPGVSDGSDPHLPTAHHRRTAPVPPRY